jgi:hypothetical protein
LPQLPPLYFEAKSKKTVPHDKPEVVHGWLTSYYTLQALHENPPPAASPGLPFPGRPLLDEATAKLVEQQVNRADEVAIDHAKDMFNRPGGCKICHAFDSTAQSGKAGIPSIIKPRIPAQWLPHSQFNHQSHRLLDCAQCHADFLTNQPIECSNSTGDVLIPKIETCFRCHAAGLPATNAKDGPEQGRPASNHCVDCHVYHDRDPHAPPFKGDFHIETLLHGLDHSPAKGDVEQGLVTEGRP